MNDIENELKNVLINVYLNESKIMILVRRMFIDIFMDLYVMNVLSALNSGEGHFDWSVVVCFV